MIVTPSLLLDSLHGSARSVCIRRLRGRFVAEPPRWSDAARLAPVAPIIDTYTLQDGELGYTGTADAQINAAGPNLNYGLTNPINVRWYVSGATQRCNFLLRFALPSFTTPPATILSATLTLYPSLVGIFGTQPVNYVGICTLKRGFIQGTKDGQTQTVGECSWIAARWLSENWTTPGAESETYDRSAPFASLPTPTQDVPISVDCTATFIAVYDGSLPWLGFVLRYPALTRSYVRFASREDPTQSKRPKLVIVTSTPG